MAATYSDDSNISSLATLCPRIQILDLSSCHRITNASIPALTTLSSLTALKTPPELTAESLETVLATLPNLQVFSASSSGFDQQSTQPGSAMANSSARKACTAANAIARHNKQNCAADGNLQNQSSSSGQQKALHKSPSLLQSVCNTTETNSGSVANATPEPACGGAAASTLAKRPAADSELSKTAAVPASTKVTRSQTQAAATPPQVSSQLPAHTRPNICIVLWGPYCSTCS